MAEAEERLRFNEMFHIEGAILSMLEPFRVGQKI